MKSKTLSILLALCMVFSAFLGLTSCDEEPTPAAPQKLSAPVITLTGEVASWEADPNADKFEISLDGTLAYVENTVTSKTLTDGQTLRVRAVGDGSSFSTSDWSNSVTFTAAAPAPTPTKLGTPSVSISASGLASWSTVANASGYAYKINGGAEMATGATSVQLSDGQSIVVKAVGDGTNYTDGDYSASQSYVAGAPAPTPTKLGTPFVSISASGLASWSAVANASGYAYKINGGTETATNVTSVQLSNGQSITVKAIGDKTNYTDSDYSTAQTYTAGSSSSASAPTYLGIFASDSEPSAANGLPDAFVTRVTLKSYGAMAGTNYRMFGAALEEYFSDSTHHLGTSLPIASDYDVYSRAGETVYVQIWLNNPSQHTILSLKLNGTKYQVGGGLSSFFVEESGQHYNCVYVAVTVSGDAHTEKTYTVTDIEYIADTYINADGTDEFMNNNDTVSIGLPYNAQNPAVSDFNTGTLTVSDCALSFTVADADGLVNTSGGWLGVAVYDGYNVVVNQVAAIGSNSVSAAGLVENTTYWITVYLYADLHDGNGVTAHVLFEQSVRTPSAITAGEIGGTLLYDAAKDGYYGAIKVNTTLNSNTAEYVKLEILGSEQQAVYTDTTYNGAATVSDDILCGGSYTVRVWYKDAEYPEGKYIEENVWIDYLGTPWYREAGGYAFVNDAVYYFQLGNGDNNYPMIDSLALKLYNEESARWVASDVLYILKNPTAIDDLNAQIEALYAQMNELPRGEEMDAVYNQIQELRELLSPLEDAKWYLENRVDNNTDIAYWEAEAAKGKYFYELTYNGTDTEQIFKVGKSFYVVLKDALKCGVDGFDVQIDFKYDKQEGGDLAEGVVKESFNVQMLNYYNGTEVRNVELDGNTLIFSLVNVDDYSISDLGGETTYQKGYVYKVIAHNDAWEEIVLYEIDSVPTAAVDEAAWLAEYIRRIKAGESVDGLYDIYVPKYEASYSITLDLTELSAGRTDITIYTRKLSEEYADGEYDRALSEQIDIYEQLPTPSIEFTEYEGRTVHDWMNNWFGTYAYEAKDQSGNPVTVSGEGGSSFPLPAPGTQVRVKLATDGYWLESEWSEWYTFEGIKVTAPALGGYSSVNCTISWSLDDTANVSHFVYTLNGGAEVSVAIDAIRPIYLSQDDVLRVKCVPTADAISNGYTDSAWGEYVCTDARTSLATPANIKIDTESACLVWDAVEGANYYVIETTFEGEVTETRFGKTSYAGIKPGAVYRVRAIPKDFETQRSSDWSGSVTCTLEQ